MTDWTVVLTAAATAVGALSAAGITAYFGYRGIVRSTDVTQKQMEEETNRTREQIEGENERLRAQHREDHLRNRQTTYHKLRTRS